LGRVAWTVPRVDTVSSAWLDRYGAAPDDADRPCTAPRVMASLGSLAMSALRRAGHTTIATASRTTARPRNLFGIPT
jgi:hypothetical protein